MQSNKTINKTPFTLNCLAGSKSPDIKGIVGNSYHAGLSVNAQGYGTYCDDGTSCESGALVYLENNEGTLRLHVYADINSENPTHTINLDQAKLSNRQVVVE